jgi:hypothetical protein
MFKPEYMIINRKLLFVYLSYIASLMHACTLFHVYYCKLLSMHVDLNTFLNKKNIYSQNILTNRILLNKICLD